MPRLRPASRDGPLDRAWERTAGPRGCDRGHTGADLHAVALKYPDVPIVIPHFGAGYFREALMVASLCPNVYFDTSSSNDWTKLQVPPITLRDAFRQALDVVGPRRLLFGTDSSFFPRGWQAPIFEAQSAALRELGVSSTDAQAIFADNLLRILAR